MRKTTIPPMQTRKKYKGSKYKEDNLPWIPAHTYEYCDKKHRHERPKGRDERISKRKARQNKRNNGKVYKDNEVENPKETVSAQKNYSQSRKHREKYNTWKQHPKNHLRR